MATLKAMVELVGEGAAAALAHAEKGERGDAVTFLVALDEGFDHPHPRLRRYVRAQIRRIERALGLPHIEETEADLALAETSRAEAAHAL